MPATANSGSIPVTGTSTTSTDASAMGLKSAPYAAGPGTGAASTSTLSTDSHSVGKDASEVAGEVAGKAKHLFEQGLATVTVCLLPHISFSPSLLISMLLEETIREAEMG
jgi:hypothetical protein